MTSSLPKPAFNLNFKLSEQSPALSPKFVYLPSIFLKQIYNGTYYFDLCRSNVSIKRV